MPAECRYEDCILLRLDQPTRDGDTKIVILSNLPKSAATLGQTKNSQTETVNRYYAIFKGVVTKEELR